MRRLLILCTHNSARSQMAEALVRAAAQQQGLALEVWSAGTEATRVKPEAVQVMAELGLDLSGQTSKTLYDLPDPWNFDVVITVCDSANELCPVYPAQTVRRHYPFTDPSGGSLEQWRAVRDLMVQHFGGPSTADRPVAGCIVSALRAGHELPDRVSETRASSV